MALFFSGDDDAVLCGNASAVQEIWNGGATAMAWIFPHSFGGGDFARILDKEDASSTGWLFFIDDNTGAGDAVRFLRHWTSTAGDWMVTGVISAFTWVHLAVTYDDDSDSNVPTIYVNGVAQSLTTNSSPSGTRTSDASTRLMMGNRVSSGRVMDGRIADARLYNRELSADEILSIYTMRGRDRNINGLVRHWRTATLPDRLAPNTIYADHDQAVQSDTGSISLPVPGEEQDGDTLVMCVSSTGDSSGTPANITTPGGWTQRVHLDLPSTASTPVMAIYTRTASSEPASYTVSQNQTAPMAGVIKALRGTSSSTPDANNTDTGESSTPTSPAVTPSSDAVVVRFAVADDNDIPTVPPDFYPSDLRGRAVLTVDGVGNGGTLGIGEEHRAGGVSTGTKAWALTASEQWAAATLAWELDPNSGDEGLPVKDLGPDSDHGEIWQKVVSRDNELAVGRAS